MKSLVWLRSDLRLNDNPALMAACKNHDEVHVVYIFSKNQFTSHNESNVKVDFIISNLFHPDYFNLKTERADEEKQEKVQNFLFVSAAVVFIVAFVAVIYA